MDRIVICAAMPMETRAICRRLKVAPLTTKKLVANVRSPFSDTELIVITSGVGCKRMQDQLNALPEASTACWLSIGAAGGLTQEMKVGSCIRGTDVVTEDQSITFDSSWSGEEAHKLFCSDTPLLTQQSKADHHQRYGADLVDMESAAVARHAKSRGECFVWIKVVSDGANEVIPTEALQCIGEDGFPNMGASIKTLLRKPWALPALIQLGARTSKLDSVLADAVFEFINQFEYNSGCNA